MLLPFYFFALIPTKEKEKYVLKCLVSTNSIKFLFSIAYLQVWKERGAREKLLGVTLNLPGITENALNTQTIQMIPCIQHKVNRCLLSVLLDFHSVILDSSASSPRDIGSTVKRLLL